MIGITGGTGFVGSCLTGFLPHAVRVGSANYETLKDKPLTTLILAAPIPPNDMLDWAATHGVERILYLSSGAASMARPEYDAYSTMKRNAERTCQEWNEARTFRYGIVIARLWTFLGPNLPQDQHYAAGQFFGMALRGEPIVVNDAAPIRSYLYAYEMANAIVDLLDMGMAGNVYNIGSTVRTSIGDLAQEIGRQADVPVLIKSEGEPTEYVPANCWNHQYVDLEQSVRRTFDYYGRVRA